MRLDASMLISSAIKNLQLLSFTYDGYSRVSESGEYVGWKLFHVNKMYGVTVLQDKFSGARPKYKRGDRAFSRIYAQL